MRTNTTAIIHQFVSDEILVDVLVPKFKELLDDPLAEMSSSQLMLALGKSTEHSEKHIFSLDI
jgi:hypothetical protein